MITAIRNNAGRLMRRFGINPGAIIMKIMGIITYDKQTHTYVREVMGHRMHVHPYDPGLSQALIKYGMREPESVLGLMQNITPDMTVMDLGANIGFYVLLEAHIISKGTGRIIAIEPFPENVRLLNINLEANGYNRNAKVIHAACSDSTGAAKFTVSELSNCGKLTKQNDIHLNTRTIDVPIYTFADLLQLAKISAKELDFLRMDIEGAEYTILPGILDILADKESFLMFIEFHPTKDLQIHANILKRLERMGYVCLNVVKEYIEHGTTKRRYCPDATIQDLYTNDFYLQGGGIEVFLRKG